jgi:hypothetical protein
VIAIVAFVLLLHYGLRWSWSLSAALIISMFLHECGHGLVFGLARIRYIILFLFPLGAVAAPINKEEDARSDKLHWYTISWLLQAGPAVNVLLILLFLALRPVFQQTFSGAILPQFAQDMIYVNGLLAAMNLVPLWTLDAGQLFKVIYSSLEEREDNWFTGLLLSGAIVLLAIIGFPGFVSWAFILRNTFFRLGWVVFLLTFAVGLLNKQGRDDPLHAYSKQAMNNRQVLIQLVVYVVQVGITLWVFSGPLL